MGYTSLSVEKEVLEKFTNLYKQMNGGGLFRSKSAFLKVIVDFFAQSAENRKALLRFWIERNPELKETLMTLLSVPKETEDSDKIFEERLMKELEGGFEGLEDKEI